MCAGGGCGWRQSRGTITIICRARGRRRRYCLRGTAKPYGRTRRTPGRIVVNAISTLVVARVGTPRRAGVVLGIGIARARAQAPPARHSTGYHSTDDAHAHAPLCTEQFVACCPLHTGLAAILGGLQYYKYAQVTRDKSARLSSPMRLRLHR